MSSVVNSRKLYALVSSADCFISVDRLYDTHDASGNPNPGPVRAQTRFNEALKKEGKEENYTLLEVEVTPVRVVGREEVLKAAKVPSKALENLTPEQLKMKRIEQVKKMLATMEAKPAEEFVKAPKSADANPANDGADFPATTEAAE